MAKINFGGTMEDVVTSEEFTVKKAQDWSGRHTVRSLKQWDIPMKK